MPLDTECLSSHSRLDFCLALKAARERKGVTLAEIAETTKIAASVFAALERNDLRSWPKGLFRRSFFRDYARAIGLPVAEACAEFVRLFPEDEGAAPPAATVRLPVSDRRISFFQRHFWVKVARSAADAIGHQGVVKVP
jgi:cytoskeletal protein RodZ